MYCVLFGDKCISFLSGMDNYDRTTNKACPKNVTLIFQVMYFCYGTKRFCIVHYHKENICVTQFMSQIWKENWTKSTRRPGITVLKLRICLEFSFEKLNDQNINFNSRQPFTAGKKMESTAPLNNLQYHSKILTILHTVVKW